MLAERFVRFRGAQEPKEQGMNGFVGGSFREKIERDHEALEISKAETEIDLPDFITHLKSVIKEHGKPPLIIRAKADELPPKYQSVPRHGPNSTELLNKIDNTEYRVREFDTKLIATIPLNGVYAKVTISTTKYPEDEKGELTNGQTIQINIDKRKSVLVIDEKGAEIHSKKWSRETGRNPSPIGGPAKKRDATAKDIRKYSEILSLLNSEGIIFERKTPPIVDRLPTTPENLEALREAQAAKKFTDLVDRVVSGNDVEVLDNNRRRKEVTIPLTNDSYATMLTVRDEDTTNPLITLRFHAGEAREDGFRKPTRSSTYYIDGKTGQAVCRENIPGATEKEEILSGERTSQKIAEALGETKQFIRGEPITVIEKETDTFTRVIKTVKEPIHFEEIEFLEAIYKKAA